MVIAKQKNLALKELIDNYSSFILCADDLSAAKRALCKKYQLIELKNAEILEYCQTLNQNTKKRLQNFLTILRKRAIRTLSGVAPVAVLTKPYPCPGHCAYCPTEKDVPTSYLANEPAVMRAIRCKYDPYKQTSTRLSALEKNGHHPNKIEIIVIGGTWSYLPVKYQYWFIANCFKAANDFSTNRRTANLSAQKKIPLKLSLFELKDILKEEQSRNEKASYRIIGLTLETRPDYIDQAELLKMREFGCTRVEIGVQAVDDKILALNQRGHGVKEIIEATKLLKQFGFKVTYHIMPALPGSNAKKDFTMFEKLFSEDHFQPDQLKFYPTVVTKNSLLYKWWSEGKYKPYSDKTLRQLIIACKAIVPPYVRIIRLIRDIPEESIVAGNKITNLRQIMQQEGAVCNCIRCREPHDLKKVGKHKINIIEYPASGGKEYFIEATSLDQKILYGFCRLRLDNNSPIAPAIIRELHVYGELVPVGGTKIVQHAGLGKGLLSTAEKVAKKNHAKKIAVISGIGVRAYYKRQGYRIKNTYLEKKTP